MDHGAFLKDLPNEERVALNAQTNAHGLVHLALYLSFITLLALGIVWQLPGWQILMLPLGIMLVFLFTLQHETTHDTAFRSPVLNKMVRVICGILLLNPPVWFRYFHFAHHRHTHDPDHDPELSADKPESFRHYVGHISGLPLWWWMITVLITNASGRASDPFVPSKARRRVKHEAQMMLIFYLLLWAASVSLWTSWLLYLWILPILLGQPFLRLYLMAEHGRCPHVANMFVNTRTTFTNALVRFLAWNMPYHAEHHACPTVPFHQLPRLHQLAREHLRTTENGYHRFHQKFVADLS